MLAFPAVASAGTVTLASGSPFATITALAGETNNLTVENYFSALSITDAGAPLQIKKGCGTLPSGAATCDGATGFDVRLGDRDDRASALIAGSSRIWGGTGNDTLSGNSYGGAAEVHGDSGNDTIFAGGAGGQIADGGSGDDSITSGGFEGQAAAYGGSGNDVISHSTQLGGPGDIQGGTGDDVITSTVLRYTSAIDGGPGDDIIAIDGPDRMFGPNPSANNFTITAGDGNDSVVGGPKDDTIDAGPGRDLVDVRDGGTDTVACGDGVDVARVDSTDTVAADCEVVIN
jgi:Ca2+-binding RTX toxin-like protein